MLNFNGDIFLLVLGVSNTFGLGTGSGAGVGILSLIGNIQLLKSLRTFSLAPRNSPRLFRKDFFQLVLHLYL